MRRNTCWNSAASWLEVRTRWSVWAAHAHGQKGLLLVGAGKAEQPLATGELRHQALDLSELEIRPALAARRDIDGLSAVEPVADCADRNRVLAGHQPRAREAVRAL